MTTAHALPMLLAAVMLVSSALPVGAQSSSPDPSRPGPFFVGGSMVFSSRHREIQDPPGTGYLHPLFHGSLEWPAAGAVLTGGGRVTQTWSLGGELTLRRSKSAAISEEEQSGHFEFVRLSSTYTDRERLYSMIARRHIVKRTASLEPVVGVTLAHTTQSLTNRRGQLQYPSGTLPVQRPDMSVSALRPGVVGGADVVFPTASGLAVSVGTRIHWIKRAHYDEYERLVPHAGPIVFSFNGGIAWQPRLRATN